MDTDVRAGPWFGRVTSEKLRERLARFRDEAVQLDIPADEVDRWMDMVRPCAVLSTRDDGPVAARFGGPVLLPVGTPHPPFPYVASIDLAALPQASADLPLPDDGRLLLFACPRGVRKRRGLGSARELEPRPR
ncbi:hypothetical protein ACI3K5_01515 [Streptomyces sp. MPA0124]|uniref:hypothetical protein n=1 Tax=Streptomyces sp. MPA0124 TaxID=3378069 RepID=UPI00385338C7